ncbi:MAG: septum formation protein Maf [Bdellovibrio sp. CG12_big_fil_rev_8_21_14_0_65_39_13]|nr:MAG: septum formation protein Maf [Bdellovibrio sp. CG22_combo_CG10-13_8_21_14_all_39_27]PIQ58274.1 MAG: septum formation protein Maf [Bdellovibrio sp. CG12_big_fil_rev_8_21_14_0_65_39_13]PIR36683.1 MAG: septum formation protein Maf [Bdellovibrio sp. CG11_big_fil_rev_8_21_14_0_20_39_38]
MSKIILATTSSYRQALFKRLAIPFQAIGSNVNEDAFKNKGLSLIELTETLALLKARDLARKYPDSIIIGSDQAVGFNDLVFSKPGTAEKAMEQLASLSGKTHQLVTSVAIIQGSKEILFHQVTQLKMRELTLSQIKNYISLDSPLDCAGSYKIEEHGIALFESIAGQDFNSIIGLPLMETLSILRNEFQVDFL